VTAGRDDLETIAAAPAGSAGAGAPSAERGSRSPVVAAIAVAMIVAALASFAITRSVRDGQPFDRSLPIPTPNERGGATTNPPDPDEDVLAGLGIRQADAGDDYSVQAIRNGDRVAGTVTLDPCNWTYPSETLRTARLQLIEANLRGDVVLSTEAVLYRNPDATAQAFRELREAAARCPDHPVPSPTGGRTLTTTFNAPPDRAWPRTQGVERLAFDIDTIDDEGTRDHYQAVYLRRGRALLAVYFYESEAKPKVGAATTPPAIVRVFEQRLAALPGEVVNRR
jgi:hypothetical protein